MNYKKTALILFILVAAAQLYVPATMILNYETVLKEGEEWKFQVRPIDPNDPFIGKYVALYFKDDVLEIRDEKQMKNREKVYVTFKRSSKGYALIDSVYKEKPDHHNYLKAKIRHNWDSDVGMTISIEYPFNRYYMEESKAFEAENVYRKSAADSNQVAYATVKIKNGDAVIKEVMIEGRSLKEIVQERLSKK